MTKNSNRGESVQSFHGEILSNDFKDLSTLQACREQQVTTISERLIHKLSVQAPPKVLVEKYLVEIAKNYNVEYEPDPQVRAPHTI